MPGASRLRELFGAGTALRTTQALLPGGIAGATPIVANGLFGGYIAATADSALGRVRVDAYWPGIRYAIVERVDAAGTAEVVRGGDPALMCTGWARWDYEAPLDAPVTYRLTSAEAVGAITVTVPVTVDSGGRFWLKHVAKPSLNMLVRVKSRGRRDQADKRGILRPSLRPDPIIVHQVRTSDSGTISLYAADGATETALRQLLADGSPVLLQYPAIAGGESLYLSVGAVPYDPVSRFTARDNRVVGLPFDTMTRPPGAAAGDPSCSYADSGSRHQTYNQAAAAYATYLDLSMASS